MIEEGTGGRSAGLTDWHLMDVSTMWTTLQDHETNGHWRHVAGWRRTSELALVHLTRLRRYRQGLAEAWPPEKSAASRAYLAELDQLIETVQHTHDVASANYTVLSAATSAISLTRHELKKLHEQYAEKVRLKQAYEETTQPRPIPRAGRPAPGQPPVTDADLEQLNVQARSLMYGLSSELHQAQAMLRQPPPLSTAPIRQPNDSDVYGPIPIIPPITPVPAIPASSTRTVRLGSSAARAVPIPAAPSAGPVLNGVSPGLVPAQASPNTIPGVTPTLTNPSPGASPLPNVPPPPGLSPRGPFEVRKGHVPAGPGKPHGVGSGTTSSTPRPMPLGGLIGGTPGAGLNQPAPGQPSARRFNPVGGVISGGGAGTAPMGAAGSRPNVGRGPLASGQHGMSPTGVGPGLSGQFGRSRECDAPGLRRWDTDSPWETSQGVDPVVRPPEKKGPIDPGPAIGFRR